MRAQAPSLLFLKVEREMPLPFSELAAVHGDGGGGGGAAVAVAGPPEQGVPRRHGRRQKRTQREEALQEGLQVGAVNGPRSEM